jgi:AcrR family transcriptional regulator
MLQRRRTKFVECRTIIHQMPKSATAPTRSSGRTPGAAPARARAPRGRPVGERSPTAREALLDATQRVMLDEGYAAVSSRRVAAVAGTDKALVHYYFGTMDDLFIALFRRSAETRAAQLGDALASRRPLWALWDVLLEQSSTALMTEFIALANHRKAVKAVMVDNSRKFRDMQLDGLAATLAGYGLEPQDWPPAAVIVLLSAISRYVRTDEMFGVERGHGEAVALVERHIAALEGARATSPVS